MLPFIAVTRPAENHCCETKKVEKRQKKMEGGKRGGGRGVDLEICGRMESLGKRIEGQTKERYGNAIRGKSRSFKVKNWSTEDGTGQNSQNLSLNYLRLPKGSNIEKGQPKVGFYLSSILNRTNWITLACNLWQSTSHGVS